MINIIKSDIGISDESSVVSCGGDKFATACAKCQNGEAGCKGECIWMKVDGECLSPSKSSEAAYLLHNELILRDSFL